MYNVQCTHIFIKLSINYENVSDSNSKSPSQHSNLYTTLALFPKHSYMLHSVILIVIKLL